MNPIVKKEVKIIIDKRLKKILEENYEKLIIGSGTITDYLLSNCQFKKIDMASGLAEEKAMELKGIRIKYLKEISDKKFTRYKYIIFAAIGYKDILLNNLDFKFKEKII